jgi:hypothetical protein
MRWFLAKPPGKMTNERKGSDLIEIDSLPSIDIFLLGL